MVESQKAYHSHAGGVALCDQIAAAEAQLARDLRGRLRDASVSVQPGGVVIHGFATSFYVKQLALHTVRKHVSLPVVANAIEVHAPLRASKIS
jgi:hypothetical protein